MNTRIFTRPTKFARNVACDTRVGVTPPTKLRKYTRRTPTHTCVRRFHRWGGAYLPTNRRAEDALARKRCSPGARESRISGRTFTGTASLRVLPTFAV